MQAVLDPFGMPVATDVVSGERADDPLYIPCIARVQASLGRRGLLYVGDCKMASRETRAVIAAAGDFYLCPLPQVQRAEGEFAAALQAVWKGERTLIPVFRERPDGTSELLAEGYEYPVPMSQAVGGAVQSWAERRLMVRSVRHAQAAEAALRARVAKAMAQMEALNQRGRGKKRVEEVSTVRQAVGAIVQRYGVENLVWFRLTQHATPRPGGGRLGSQKSAMPPSRSVWMRSLWRRRYGGWGGACMARITRWSRCPLRKRCWPIAVHIWWSEAWGGSKDARCRSRRCMYSAMTMPPGSSACCQSPCGC